jgi:hypothetical protein
VFWSDVFRNLQNMSLSRRVDELVTYSYVISYLHARAQRYRDKYKKTSLYVTAVHFPC